MDAGLHRQKSGATFEAAAESARSAARDAEKAYRDRWWNWALQEFGGDSRLAQVGMDALLPRLLAGESSEGAVAAAHNAVNAERQTAKRPGPNVSRMDGEATAALVLGIGGLLCGGMILNGLAIWLGRRSQRRIEASGGLLEGANRAKTGFYLGIAGLILWAAIILIYFGAALGSPSPSPSG